MLYNNIWQRDGQVPPPKPPARRQGRVPLLLLLLLLEGRVAAGSVKATQRNGSLLDGLEYLLNMNILITVIMSLLRGRFTVAKLTQNITIPVPLLQLTS